MLLVALSISYHICPICTSAGVAAKMPQRGSNMSIFRRPDYRSEATQFIDALKTAKPELEAQQRQGRALLWDKAVDRSAVAQARAAKVAQQPYVYQTSSK